MKLLETHIRSELSIILSRISLRSLSFIQSLFPSLLILWETYFLMSSGCASKSRWSREPSPGLHSMRSFQLMCGLAVKNMLNIFVMSYTCGILARITEWHHVMESSRRSYDSRVAMGDNTEGSRCIMWICTLRVVSFYLSYFSICFYEWCHSSCTIVLDLVYLSCLRSPLSCRMNEQSSLSFHTLQ
jgi:hypothetical protein